MANNKAGLFLVGTPEPKKEPRSVTFMESLTDVLMRMENNVNEVVVLYRTNDGVAGVLHNFDRTPSALVAAEHIRLDLVLNNTTPVDFSGAV